MRLQDVCDPLGERGLLLEVQEEMEVDTEMQVEMDWDRDVEAYEGWALLGRRGGRRRVPCSPGPCSCTTQEQSMGDGVASGWFTG